MKDEEARILVQELEGMAATADLERDGRVHELSQCLTQAVAHVHAERWAQARVALERAHALDPHSPRVDSLLGQVYFKLGLLDRARVVYQRLRDAHPGEAALEVNLGLVHMRLGAAEAARQALERAVHLAPDHTRAHAYLGLVLHRQGALEEAHHHLVRGRAEGLAQQIAGGLPSTISAVGEISPEGAPRVAMGTARPGNIPFVPAETIGFDEPRGGQARLTLNGPVHLRRGACLARSGDVGVLEADDRLNDAWIRLDGQGVAWVEAPPNAVVVTDADHVLVKTHALVGFIATDLAWASEGCLHLEGATHLLFAARTRPQLLAVGDTPVRVEPRSWLARSTELAVTEDPNDLPLLSGPGWVLLQGGIFEVDDRPHDRE